jgi:hypothetical protein
VQWNLSVGVVMDAIIFYSFNRKYVPVRNRVERAVGGRQNSGKFHFRDWDSRNFLQPSDVLLAA